ncbi:MAG: hypothetical protein JWN33_143 [Candidatus Saccharibacteria bacterium]|nr:hypothetical protein [Candidatus Saccharibacteria bacterium]
MHRLWVGVMVVVAAHVYGLGISNVHAEAGNVVISQIKPANISTARLIELYNNSTSPTEITGWCVFYSSASNLSLAQATCFNGTSVAEHLFLPSYSSLLVASAELNIVSDSVLVIGLGTGTAGHIYLKDASGQERDRVGWGTAVNPEGGIPATIGTTKVIERKGVIGSALQDTNQNSNDFFQSQLRPIYQTGALYEELDVCQNLNGIQTMPPDGFNTDGTNCTLPAVDDCSNIDGVQVLPPAGYGADETGKCFVDQCLNMNGLQIDIPADYRQLEGQDCEQIDLCDNIDGAQLVVPENFGMDASQCFFISAPLKVTELLANKDGTDANNEFIEIYNSSDQMVELDNYLLQLGTAFDKSYHFPSGAVIGPHGYYVLSNADVPYSLLNTSSQVRLVTIDGQEVARSDPYVDPKEDEAWALIDGQWQYTNQPTPGLPNLAWLEETTVGTDDTTALKPCADNQYRSPETNRCRLIAVATVLAPCKDGQYRSEQTNRCRSIASDIISLVPCAEGQERNPLTNRCRQMLTASTDLVPCKEGQERSPETNRCRNIVSMPDVGYPVLGAQTFAQQGSGMTWLFVGAGSLAAGYGVWEWRVELVGGAKRIWSYRKFLK